MATERRYTVYKAGQADPVRVVGRQQAGEPEASARVAEAAAGGAAAAALAQPLHALPRRAEGRRRSAPPQSGGGHRRTILVFVAALAAAAAAVLLFWLYGRQPVEDAISVLDLARSSGRIPSWLWVTAPALAAVVLVAITTYLAFGRHLSLKIVGLAVLVAGLAAPGFALGWTNGTLNTVGNRDKAVTEVVRKTREKLQPPLPGKAVNLLLIGSDSRPGDPGRSDTQVVVRLDPVTKSISMLSLPRDLRVDIPGYGLAKINEAYTYGGAPLTVETVGAVTGLPIHHFVEVNFDGFWHVVKTLGGVYYPVDRRYYNPESSTWKSIDLQPGYQLMDGHDALDFVRFRHDQRGDFSRMQRQQSFLKELQRQSGRWNNDWRRVTKLLQSITDLTTSDLDSLHRILPLASLALTLDTSKVYTVQVEGSSQMIDGLSYVIATPEEIAAAVQQFSAPAQPETATKGRAMPKSAYEVHISNGNGVPGQATATAQALTDLGYNAVAIGTLPTTYASTIVLAPEGMENTAQQFVRLFAPAELQIVRRTQGSFDGITVYTGLNFDGGLNLPTPESTAGAYTVTEGAGYNEAGWKSLDAQTQIKLQMPDAWVNGAVYDQFYAYELPTTDGKNVPATVAVGRTAQGDYFSFQTMRWFNPPAIAHPTSKRTINGTQYLLFYNDADLHMVAWRHGSTLYWVLNSLDDKLPESVMLSLATSFRPLS